MDSKTAEKKGGNMRGLDMVVDCASETSLRAFLEKILDLNPIPYSKIREIGPLISQTKKQEKQKSLI